MPGHRTGNSDQAQQLPGRRTGGSETSDGGRDGASGRVLRFGGTRMQAWDGRRAGNLNWGVGLYPETQPWQGLVVPSA